MLEPQSSALFLILLVVFSALTCWMVATKYLVFRLLAGRRPSRDDVRSAGGQQVLRLLRDVGRGGRRLH